MDARRSETDADSCINRNKTPSPQPQRCMMKTTYTIQPYTTVRGRHCWAVRRNGEQLGHGTGAQMLNLLYAIAQEIEHDPDLLCYPE